MTRLKARIVDMIDANGPMPVSDYMALCLFDPAEGYYTTREPFGGDGDFITAPEISQMFGELVAVWIHAAWEAQGRPASVTIAEIGPGRGTLMKDVLRTLTRLEPELARNASFAMVEASPRLTTIQRDTLGLTVSTVNWHKTIATLPPGPLIIVGNELFDALPVRQYVRVGDAWRERAVGRDDNGDLVMTVGLSALDPEVLPFRVANALQGAVVEVAPARSALMQTIAEHIASHGGSGLFIDYGYLKPGLGDTFQALRAHRAEPVLESPGAADLTAHVDFSALASVARHYGLDARLMDQGEFLLGMGLLERAGALGANAGEAIRARISSEVERLAGPDQMGKLFKVLAITTTGTTLPPARASD